MWGPELAWDYMGTGVCGTAKTDSGRTPYTMEFPAIPVWYREACPIWGTQTQLVKNCITQLGPE